MSVVRSYRLTIADGAQESFREAVGNLEAAAARINGFEGAELLQDLGNPEIFQFRERWASVDHHAKSGDLIPRTIFKALMQCLALPPEATTMMVIPIR